MIAKVGVAVLVFFSSLLAGQGLEALYEASAVVANSSFLLPPICISAPRNDREHTAWPLSTEFRYDSFVSSSAVVETSVSAITPNLVISAVTGIVSGTPLLLASPTDFGGHQWQKVLLVARSSQTSAALEEAPPALVRTKMTQLLDFSSSVRSATHLGIVPEPSAIPDEQLFIFNICGPLDLSWFNRERTRWSRCHVPLFSSRQLLRWRIEELEFERQNPYGWSGIHCRYYRTCAP